MEQPNGNPCPECGAPRNSDNTPSCACTVRASDALRDARTAEAAAAEDFDPLRIRPYVELDDGAGRSTPDGPAEAAGAVGTSAPSTGTSAPSAEGPGAPGAADETMTLRAVPPEAAPGAADATSVLPTPLAPGTARPNATDLHLFDTTRPLAAVPAAPGPVHTGGEPPRRRRRGTLFAVAGAVVAVVGAAGWASGVFSYETPSRDGAAPEEVRASIPDPSSSASSSAEPSADASSAAPSSSASSSASPSASASASASASPSPSASTTSASPSASAEPSSTPTTTAPSDSAEDTEEEGGDTGPVLRRGDRGPEVTELQLRLKEKWLYNDEINGQFNRRVEDALRNYQWSRGLQAELGVYGPQTRARLEAETQGP
ncbi:peptidoglycan-binding domain-containing protein [Streptomyces sp. NRRL S-37]|uniref:peptidoglycan-binding domain-containing protein n=1 Tax=Streptomyces sp. NRRL S-37 TaxID=1463903 RepID=UPI0004C77C45|nr:peptidoglycan-binding domain-containing protein [Streptomyces sp. NRRL S-37]